MANKKVRLPDGTEIMLVKHPRARNIKLTITAKGQIRVGMPGWVPYGVGLAFAKSNSEWIARQSGVLQLPMLKTGHKIGKSYRLIFIHKASTVGGVQGRIEGHIIKVQSSLNSNSPVVQKKALQLCEQALRADSEKHLIPRINQLSSKYGLKFAKVSLRKLTSRWGSCSEKKNISLNIYLVQLPAELIDYVILHELMHTKHLNHSKQFWGALNKLMPNTPALRRRLKKYRPRLAPA